MTSRFGPLTLDGVTSFRLWAPKQHRVLLQVERQAPVAMQPAEGWHFIRTIADFGTRYAFKLEDGTVAPDPASRFQPGDVHGPSELVDPAAYQWTNISWRGRPWHEFVLYEMHIGTFTAQGTFAAAAQKLSELAALGITGVQVMPIADFPGRRNWGYDGVLPFAPDSSYGRPDDVKAFVDAAHELGIAVLLDVVYNHFGPEGNYLPLCAPFLTDKHTTPWGAAVNYDDADSETVRAFVVENALYWLDEFRFDGLRFDAVHEIRDDSQIHLLDEISRAIGDRLDGRHIHLVLENEENDARWLERQDGTARSFTAQWNDDMHHVLHVAVTGEDSGYYGDYVGRLDLLGRALAEGFAFQGEPMPYRGSARGQISSGLPPQAFVAFLQNHDQVGNRAIGDRINHTHPLEAVRAAAAVYLLAPQIPMIFQGEEWAASTPFPFFCDFPGDLANAIRDGRRKEFARFPEYATPEARSRIPDPTAEETFLSAKLRWDERSHGDHGRMLSWYRRILEVRAGRIMPLISQIERGGDYAVDAAGVLEVRWTCNSGWVLTCLLNLSASEKPFARTIDGEILWIEGNRDAGSLAPWTVVWTMSRAG